MKSKTAFDTVYLTSKSICWITAVEKIRFFYISKYIKFFNFEQLQTVVNSLSLKPDYYPGVYLDRSKQCSDKAVIYRTPPYCLFIYFFGFLNKNLNFFVSDSIFEIILLMSRVSSKHDFRLWNMLNLFKTLSSRFSLNWLSKRQCQDHDSSKSKLILWKWRLIDAMNFTHFYNVN